MADPKKKVGVHGTPAETKLDKVPGTLANEQKQEAEEKKKECVITKKQWDAKAPAAVTVPATIATKKNFSTGTMGYYAQVSAVIEVDGVPVKLTGNCQLYVANSKEAKAE